MKTPGYEVKNIIIEVKAGPRGENSDVYAYIHSPVPHWARTVDDPFYSLYAENALEIAKKIVRESGRDITLKLSVK